MIYSDTTIEMYANFLGSHTVEAAPELYFSDEEANIILSTQYFNDFDLVKMVADLNVKTASIFDLIDQKPTERVT